MKDLSNQTAELLLQSVEDSCRDLLIPELGRSLIPVLLATDLCLTGVAELQADPLERLMAVDEDDDLEDEDEDDEFGDDEEDELDEEEDDLDDDDDDEDEDDEEEEEADADPFADDDEDDEDDFDDD